eukprot:GSChrysophyteH1.ASY1.ANO1.2493.1 assembled CDS
MQLHMLLQDFIVSFGFHSFHTALPEQIFRPSDFEMII